MKDPVQFRGLSAAQLPSRPLHLAIGIFDGVHLGHRAVIQAAVLSAEQGDGAAAVLTFWPHPSVLLRPDQPTKMLLNESAKLHLLGKLGVQWVITQPFTTEFASIAAEDFLPLLRRFLPHLDAIYVGENWRFGHGRRGDVALLATEGKRFGLSVFSAPRVNLNGEPISSSRIRALIELGEMEEASRMLGYHYFSEGVVTPGKQLGRALGFPTLNLPWSPDLRPRYGVYAVRVTAPERAGAWRGVANYGLRPTVETASEPRLEVHLLEPCPFDRGSVITVEWLHFVRPEKKFGSVDELRGQIAEDRTMAQNYFARLVQ
jgi:riboflavin kinase/FMN adenylyltransferase